MASLGNVAQGNRGPISLRHGTGDRVKKTESSHPPTLRGVLERPASHLRRTKSAENRDGVSHFLYRRK